MKRIFALPLFLSSCACFAQTQQGPTYTQATDEQIQAIREQVRSIGQANIDRQRATLLADLLTPKADPKLENQRLDALKAFNAMRAATGQPPLQ